MGTKKDPGKFDCYAKLADDEPYFVLRAKDPMAPRIVRMWANMSFQGQPSDKIAEANMVSGQMESWRWAKEEEEAAAAKAEEEAKAKEAADEHTPKA